MERFKKVFIICVLVVSLLFFIGSGESYNFKQYKLNGYKSDKSYQLVLDEYAEYINICDEYKIEKDYEETYFDTNSLVLFYIRSNSGSYDYSVKNVIIDGNDYHVTIENKIPSIIDCSMKDYIILLEENDEVLNNINNVIVDVIEK